MKKWFIMLVVAMCLAFGSVPAMAATKTTVAAPAAKVNINTAAAAELEGLPGIGKVTAEQIVKYRTENGPFATPDDLVRVKGIGAKSLEKIREMIVVK